ncbi:MAG: site-2 protease family protein [bacterium]
MLNLFSLAVLILSVVIHEVSHGYMALRLGDPTAKYAGRLTLNPLKHLDPIGSVIVPIITTFLGVSFGWAKPVPFNPDNFRKSTLNLRWGEALVAAAGPASNFIVAIVFGTAAHFVTNETVFSLFGLIVLVNITLAIFNLAPIPPMDGSKILFACIPARYSHIRAQLERNQLILAIIFIFFLWQFFEPIIFKLFALLMGVPLGM